MLKSLFSRKKKIIANLNGANLIDVIGIKDRTKSYKEDPYIVKEYTPNHFIMSYIGRHHFKHEFQYFESKNTIEMTTNFGKEMLLMCLFPFGIYGFLLYNGIDNEVFIKETLICASLLVFLFLLNLFGMIEEAKETERELRIRLNIKGMLIKK